MWAVLASPWENAGSLCHWLGALELHAAHRRERPQACDQSRACQSRAHPRVCAHTARPRSRPKHMLLGLKEVAFCRLKRVFRSELLGPVCGALPCECLLARGLLSCVSPARAPSTGLPHQPSGRMQCRPLPCSPPPPLPTAQRTSAVSNHKTWGKSKVSPHQEKIGVPCTRGTAI